MDDGYFHFRFVLWLSEEPGVEPRQPIAVRFLIKRANSNFEVRLSEIGDPQILSGHDLNPLQTLLDAAVAEIKRCLRGVPGNEGLILIEGFRKT
jgi:hypothetical protein